MNWFRKSKHINRNLFSISFFYLRWHEQLHRGIVCSRYFWRLSIVHWWCVTIRMGSLCLDFSWLMFLEVIYLLLLLFDFTFYVDLLDWINSQQWSTFLETVLDKWRFMRFIIVTIDLFHCIYYICLIIANSTYSIDKRPMSSGISPCQCRFWLLMIVFHDVVFLWSLILWLLTNNLFIW